MRVNKINRNRRIAAVIIEFSFVISLFGGFYVLPLSASDKSETVYVSGLISEDFSLAYPDFSSLTSFDETIPTAYDARSHGYTSSVKDQTGNGLCWAFAANSVAEANMLKNGQGGQDFSETHMGYSTSNRSGNTLEGWDRTPGAGGNRYQSSSYLMRGTNLSGTVNESDDPYPVKTALPLRDLAITQSKPKSFSVQNFLFLSGDNEKFNSPEVIKQAILRYGAVGAGMQLSGNAGQGGTEYYNTFTYSYYSDKIIETDGHDATIVGWNDDYARTWFNAKCRPAENGAWLVKNSWGNKWGDKGYFWVSYEDCNFPVNAYTIDGVKPVDKNTDVYEDDFRLVGTYGFAGSSSDKYYTEVFEVKNRDEKLSSVKVMLGCSSIKTTVYVTENFTTVASINAETPSMARESLECPGWYTFEFDEPVALGSVNSKFAVTVRIANTSGQPNRIGVGDVSSKQNQTFMAQSSLLWTENDNNFAIKAVVSSDRCRCGKSYCVECNPAYEYYQFTEAQTGNSGGISIKTNLKSGDRIITSDGETRIVGKDFYLEDLTFNITTITVSDGKITEEDFNKILENIKKSKQKK